MELITTQSFIGEDGSVVGVGEKIDVSNSFGAFLIHSYKAVKPTDTPKQEEVLPVVNREKALKKVTKRG